MDYFHLKQYHDDEMQQIIKYSFDHYKFQSCDVNSCDYSSRLYRVVDTSARINIFDNDDKTSSHSSLLVVINMLDCIHHYIYHIQQCGLRDSQRNGYDNEIREKEKDDSYHHDAKFAAMSKRISSTTKNVQRFSRIAAGNKFSIDVKVVTQLTFLLRR